MFGSVYSVFNWVCLGVATLAAFFPVIFNFSEVSAACKLVPGTTTLFFFATVFGVIPMVFACEYARCVRVFMAY